MDQDVLNQRLEKIDEIKRLLAELRAKYPYGEFLDWVHVSLDFGTIEGRVLWDWKAKVHHIEQYSLDQFIDYLKNEGYRNSKKGA